MKNLEKTGKLRVVDLAERWARRLLTEGYYLKEHNGVDQLQNANVLDKKKFILQIKGMHLCDIVSKSMFTNNLHDFTYRAGRRFFFMKV